MPRYFFDVIDGGELAPDTFGIDLGGDEEAREEAISLLPCLARDRLPDADKHAFIVEARNESGEIVYQARLALDGQWWPFRNR